MPHAFIAAYAVAGCDRFFNAVWKRYPSGYWRQCVIHKRTGLLTIGKLSGLMVIDWRISASILMRVFGPPCRRFAGTLLNAAFVSDLTPLIWKADLWVHAHVHDNFDYEVVGTRVIANPRGYPAKVGTAPHVYKLEWENEAFNPALAIEI